MSMGILDFSTQSESSVSNNTYNTTDSNNRTQNTNRVMDNVGNVTMNLGGTNETTMDKILPFVAIGALALAILRS